MALIVQKFGGTSLANIERIKAVTKIIKAEIAAGNQVIIVASAMAGVTNKIIALCSELSSLDDRKTIAEYDSALCSGEIVSSSLIALSLREEGVEARSILAWQLPITTDSGYGKALVESVDTSLLKECLAQNIVPVIAGFQGITKQMRSSTLGRNGSDTTAVIIASVVQANRCDIYTDVDGVFTADPRIIHNSKKLERMSFEEMLALAASGAKVLHPRSVEIAMRYNVEIRVLSSFSDLNITDIAKGTLITSQDKIMERRTITGITSNKNLLRLIVENPELDSRKICNALARNDIHIEFMNASPLSFIIPLSDISRVEKVMTGMGGVTINTDISFVSIVGYGIKNDPGLISKILTKLSEADITVDMLQVSEIKISLLVNDRDTEKAIRVLSELSDK